MRRIFDYFRNAPIKDKLLFYFIVLILIPTVTITYLGNLIYKNSMQNETGVYTDQMLNQVSRNVDGHIKGVENFIDYLAEEREVKEFYRARDKEIAASLQDSITNKINRYSYFYKEIAGVILINEGDNYISNVMFRTSRNAFTDELWYRQTKSNPGHIQLFSNPIGRNISNIFNYSADEVVSVSKTVLDPEDQSVLGVILVDIDLNVLKKDIENVSLGEIGFIYLLDSNYDMVYSPVNSVVYRIKSNYLDKKEGSMVKKINGKDYEIVYQSSNYTGWKTIGVFPQQERLKVVKHIMLNSVIIAVVSLITAVIIAIFFTRTIVRPITKLRNLMKITEEGNFDVHFKNKYNDEIGQLGNSFNNMVKEIKNLIKLVKLEERNKRKAEMKILQAQIKPHFLYNTLDTIQWMAQEHNADDVVEMVGALTSLLRIGLSKGEEIISIKDEIKHVTSYLTIQKTRYEDKMDYEINIDEYLLGFSIIKLTLQPLVENAIYHGIKEKRGKGSIVITGELKDNLIHFMVTDNGRGIPEEKLKEIQRALSGQSGNTTTGQHETKDTLEGYGIFNVNERIRLNFGDEFGLKYESIYGSGTTVHVWYPAVLK